MVQDGLFSPFLENNGQGWTNYQQWYPGGLDMSRSLPSLPMTAAVLYTIISWLGVNVDLMAFCSIFPVIFGTVSCLLMYFVGKDMGGKSVGLFAALFLALAPSFLQRTALGFFDTEVLGIVGLLSFTLLFLRAIDKNRTLRSSLVYSVLSGLALAYLIGAWGAAYYLLDLTALFVFALLLLKRYSPRLLISYSLTFGLALGIAINIPYISLKYVTSVAVLPIAAIFVLLCIFEVLRHNVSSRTKVILAGTSFTIIVGGFLALWQFGYLRDIAGKFISVLDPFVRSAAPLIESVAEHRISAWGNIYYELGLGVIFFLAGLYFALRKPTNRNVFLLLFGATSLYFAASMVRLLVIFAPVFSLLAAMGILGVLKPFYTLLKEAPQIAIKSKRRISRVSKEYSGIVVFLLFMLLVLNFAFSPQSGGTPRVYGSAYAPLTVTAASLPLGGGNLAEPAQEWLDMLSWTRNNLQATTVVCSWWDYGYWLSIMGNVTTLADNATINTTQIENIGFIFMAPEDKAMPMLKQYDAEYILVFTTLGLATSSDTGYYVAQSVGYGDEGKWSWMARISGQARNRFVPGYISEEEAWTNEHDFGAVSNTTNAWEWNDMGKNSTIYKLLSWAKQSWVNSNTGSNVISDEEGVEPTYFKEAYFAGLELTAVQASAKYSGLIPLVALYEIDWEAYENASE
jgi:dolichyl-diphosphooligosaccharide--protein glycosyltransferase